MRAVMARPGLVVVDASLNVVASNAEAIQILTSPEHPEKIRSLDAWLANRIRSGLLDQRLPGTTGFVSEFRSAKRTYLCRSFPLHVGANGLTPSPAMVLLFERQSNSATKVAEVSEHYHLTPREHESVRLLLQGLTSKEIAERMKISPNTVKAFIRLVMVKMNVSTRPGIIGKIVAPKDLGARPHARSSPIG